MGAIPSSDPNTLLAQIIAGESNGTPGDDFGVASTIYNRTQGVSGYNGPGFGLTGTGAATAPLQFSAYPNGLGNPTPNQLALATAINNGTLSNYGDTGNATYYNAAGYAYQNNGSNAFGANASGLPSNVYSDQYQQQPSSNFQLPQVSDAQPVSNGPLQDLGSPDEASMYDQYSGFGAGNGDMNSGALTYPSLEGGAGGSFAAGNPIGYGNADLAPAPGSASTAAPSPLGPNQGTPNLGGGASQTNPSANPQGAFTSAGGSPVTVTNASDTGQVAGQAVQTGLNTVATTATTVEQSAATTGTSWLNSIFGAEGNLLVRGAFIALGVVMLLGAFLLLYLDAKPSGGVLAEAV